MREILFRAKCVNNNDWIEGFYCLTRDTTYCFAEDYEKHPVPEHHCILVDRMTDWGLPNRPTLYEVDPNTVGEYTGLKDKNGKKIFEGDIVLKRTQRKREPILVTFGGGMFHSGYGGGSSTREHRYSLDDKQIEVIGNIHDNPELLRKE